MHKIKVKNLTDKFKNVVNEKEALDIILRDNRNLKYLPDQFKKDKKFIQKLMKQIKDGNKKLFIVNDKDGTPTYTHDFAKTVKELIQKEYWGLYNCVCGGQTSRFEVAEELISLLGKKDDIKITSVNSEYFKDIYYAERPPSERLLTKKLKILLNGENVYVIKMQCH